MKHCDLLTALGLTLGHGGTPHGIALKSYREIPYVMATLCLFRCVR